MIATIPGHGNPGLMKPTPQPQKETPQEMFLRLLIERKVSFTELSETYTYYLEQKNKEKQEIICGMSVPLSQWWLGGKIAKKQSVFLKAKTAFYLLKSRVFHTAPIEKELEAFLKENPYNE